MKKLFLIRHAKSSWEEAGVSDFYRKLLPVGIERSHKVIDYLSRNRINVDKVISSPAVRAYETAKLFSTGWGINSNEILLDDRIYACTADDIYKVIFQLDDEWQSVAIFGHNPAVTDFSNHFLSKKILNMPTSAITGIEFNCDLWNEVPLAKSGILFYMAPKML